MTRVHTLAWVGLVAFGLVSPAGGQVVDLAQAARDLLAADKVNDHLKVIQIAEKHLPLAIKQFGDEAVTTEWWVYQLARSHGILEQYDKAGPHLKRLIDSKNLDSVANYRRTWAKLYLARAAMAARDYDTALKHNAAGEKVAIDSGVMDNVLRTEFPFQRGQIHQSAGEFEKAIPGYEAQGKALKAIHGDASTKAVGGEESAAWCEVNLMRFALARKRYEAVAKVYSDADKRASPGYLLSRLSVAQMYLFEKERAKAEAIFTDTEKVLKTNADKRVIVAAADNPFNSGVGAEYNTALEDADVYDRLAELNTLAGRHRDTVNARTRACELTAADPKGTPEAAYLRVDMLGRAYFSVEDHKKAQEIHTDALARAEKLYKADPPAHAWRLIGSLTALASCERTNGQYRKAEDHYIEALKLAEKHLPGSVNHADAMWWYASYLTLAGRIDQAMELEEQAENIYRSRQAGDAKRKAGEQFAEAIRMLERGESEAGWRLFEQAHSAMIIIDREQAVSQLRTLALLYEWKKDDRTAVAVIDREIALCKDVFGEDTSQTMDARLRVSETLRRLGDFKRARAEIETAARFFETSDSFNLCKL